MTRHRAQLCACISASALAGAMAWAPAALAQQAQDQVEAVVVTGSSIRGVAAVGSPTVAISREEIKQTGLASASDLARSLPQVMNLGADESRLGGAQDGGANTTKVNGINLRGLGTGATLVLVNGRRVASAGLIREVVDPNNLPNAAIAKFEVVTDGASAIYGSDAVAGVVNLIPRKNFNGAETTARYGHADGLDQTMFSQTFGKTWGGGSAFVAYEYTYRSAMNGDARDYFSADLRRFGGADNRQTISNPGTIVVGGGAAAVRYALPVSATGRITASSLVAGTSNRFDDNLFSEYLPKQKRHSLFGNVYQDIGEDLQVFWEGFGSRRKFTQRVAPLGATLTVPRSNPFFVSPNPAATTVNVEYRFLTATGDEAVFYGKEHNYQNAFGGRYKLPNDWQLNGSYALSTNASMQHRGPLANLLTMAGALSDPNPATALNPFATGRGANAQATLDRVIGYRDSMSKQLMNDYTFKADGPLFDLPAGQVRVAIGGEYQDNSFKYSVVSTIITADNSPRKQKDIRLNRTVKSVFGEVFVPVVAPDAEIPLVHKLDLSVAGRYEKYSDFGTTKNPKVALIWQPVETLTLQSTFGTSFRAPTLIDKSEASASIFINNITDPTSPTGVTRGIQNQLNNPTLKPETATTWSGGVVWSPTGALEGLTASATYYDIKYKNLIDVVQGHLTNEGLYSSYVIRNPSAAQVQAFLSSPYLESASEPASNIRVIIDSRRNNLGTMKQHGADFDLAYRFNTAIGDWRVGTQVTKVLGQKRQVTAGLPFTEVAGLFNFPIKLRVRGNLGWSKGGWSANAFVNYVGHYTNTAVTPNKTVDTWVTTDATVAYAFGEGRLEGIRLSLNGQNIFDKDPPVVLNGVNSFDSQNASAIGRMISLEVTKSW